MNCSDYQAWLQQRLDGAAGVADSEAAHDHVERCAACLVREAAVRRLEEGLMRLPVPVPPLDLAGRIVASVQRDRRLRIRRRRLVTGVLGLAASLVVVAGAVALRPYLFPVEHIPAQPAPLVQVNTPDGEEHRPARLSAESLRAIQLAYLVSQAAQGSRETIPDGSLRGSVLEFSSLVASLGLQTADQTLGQGRILLPLVSPSAGIGEPSLGETLAPPARSLRGAEEGMANVLAPVTGEARRAFDLFLREVPLETTARQAPAGQP